MLLMKNEKPMQRQKNNYCDFLLFFFFLFFISSLVAQKGHPVLKQYTSKNSGLDDYIHAVFADSKGYLWFGTNSGAIRFDGKETKKFAGEKSVQEGSVVHFQEDSNGTIWMVGLGGLVSYLEKDTFFLHLHADSLGRFCDNYCVTTGFYVENNGDAIYIAVDKYGIIKIDSKGNREILQPPTKPSILMLDGGGEKLLWQFYKDDKGKFIYEKNKEQQTLPPLYILKNDKFILADTLPNEVFKYSRKGSLKLKNGQNLLFSFGHLYLMENGKLIWHRPHPYDVTHLFEDSRGRIVISELRTGFKTYENLSDLKNDTYRSFLEKDLSTYCAEDINGGLWFSTLINGVYHSSMLDIIEYDQQSNFPDEDIRGYVQTENPEEFIVQFARGDLYSFTPEKELTIIEQGITKGKWAYSLFYEKENKRIWSSDPTLFYIKDGKRKYVYYTNKNGEKRNIRARDLVYDKPRAHLWARDYNGLACIDLNTMETILHTSNLTKGWKMDALAVDQNGQAWCSNGYGLIKWENPVFKRTKLNAIDYKDKFLISGIYPQKDSSLLLCVYGKGLLSFKDTVQWELNTSHGLSSNTVRGIHLEDENNFWVISDKGLNQVHRNEDGTFQINQFTKKSGLPNDNLFGISEINDTLWFLSDKNIVKFPKPSLKKNKMRPYVKELLVNNESQDFNLEVSLPYDENNFALTFGYFSYAQKGEINYRYQINGAANQWSYSDNPQVNLFSLSPNQYDIEFQAQDQNGKWSDSSHFKFNIDKPFWKTNLFTLIWVISFLFLIWWYYKKQLSRIEEKNATQRQINELKLTALRAQMNPHFIFNSLNSVQNFIVQNDKMNATTYLAKFAHLIRGVLNASRKEEITLEEEINLLENYLSLEKLRHKDKFDYHIRVDDQLSTSEVMLPPLLAQPFLENAIIHGFTNKKEKGIIELGFLKENSNMLITINDNGNGIYHTQSQKEKPSIHHKGVGMSISEKRLQLVKGVNDFKIEELKDESGKIRGSLIQMKIPLDLSES